MQKWEKRQFVIILIICLGILISACDPVRQPPTDLPLITEDLPPAQVSTDDVFEPTPTEEPSPIMINGESIPVDYFHHEFSRLKDSQIGLSTPLTDEEIKENVLNYLFEQQLLAQAARQSGLFVSDDDVQERINSLISELGSADALNNWLQSNHYEEAEFKLALGLSMEAALQRDAIIQLVPEAVEQVRAQQIFAYTQAGAERALANLSAGKNFNELAWEFSPESGGELGWFPRGYLLYPEVEEVAFTLEAGTISGIIQSEIGYHILLVIDHDMEHMLTTDARLSLQSKALENWLSDAKAKSEIVVNLP
jgi:parvulin-like peptidyl-prolyl isomerase